MSDIYYHEEFGVPNNNPRSTVSLESRVEWLTWDLDQLIWDLDELTRAFNELRANGSRADELAQCRETIARLNQTIVQLNQIIAQQAQEIIQLRVLVTQQNQTIAQQTQTIAQQAQEIAQLKALVTQHQQWIQTNAQPLTQAYDIVVKSDLDAYTRLVQRILDETVRSNESIPSAEFNKRVQVLGMSCYPPIHISSQKIHKIMATLGFPVQRGAGNVGYYRGLSWKAN